MAESDTGKSDVHLDKLTSCIHGNDRSRENFEYLEEEILDDFEAEIQNLTKYESLKTSEKNFFSCNHCGEPFQTESELCLHDVKCSLRPKTSRNRFTQLKCGYCEEILKSLAQLKQHLKARHPGRNDAAKCDVCNRYFNHDFFLERHKRLHTNERPFKCELCDKCFPWPEHLHAHKKTHNPEDFVCKFCKSVFTSNSALNKHERMHKGELRYICEHCGEGFHVSEPYKVHLRRHMNVRPFECGECHKTFFSRAGCRRHTLTHIDQRSFKCAHCEKSFRDKQTLDRHGRVHTGEKLSCHFCQQRLASRRNLHDHIHKIHPERCGLSPPSPDNAVDKHFAPGDGTAASSSVDCDNELYSSTAAVSADIILRVD